MTWDRRMTIMCIWLNRWMNTWMDKWTDEGTRMRILEDFLSTLITVPSDSRTAAVDNMWRLRLNHLTAFHFSLHVSLLCPGSNTAGTYLFSPHTGSLVRKDGGMNILREILTCGLQESVDRCPSLQPFRQTSFRDNLYRSHQVSAESSLCCLQQCPRYYIFMLAFSLLSPSRLLPRITSQRKRFHPNLCLKLYFLGNPKNLCHDESNVRCST